MIGKVLGSLAVVASIVAGAYAVDLVYHRQSDFDAYLAAEREKEAAVLDYMKSQERRMLRRDIRQLKKIEDTRGLTPAEKDDLRELSDQLEEVK